MSDKAIIVENISKKYELGLIGGGTLMESLGSRIKKGRKTINPNEPKEFWALKDISFTVKKGEVVGVIGKNGAGKSTLLKVISRITQPTSGQIRINGRVASLLEVGTGFHPELTGRENIFLNGSILGMTRKEIKVKFDEIVDFSGVEKFIDTPVKRYSSGMYVRLAFSVAAHLEPEILVIDEVLAVGDMEFQKKCLGKMENVAKGGRTVLFVSHNMAAVESLCQSAILLRHGEVTYKGSTNEAIESYLNFSTPSLEKSLNGNISRSGTGDVQFTKIILNGSKPIIAGHSLTIEVQYEWNKVQKNISELPIAISITDLKGSMLSVLSSDYSGNPIYLKKPKGSIVCKVPSLNLIAGIYSINLWINSMNSVSDYIQNAISFQVNDADYFHTGKNL